MAPENHPGLLPGEVVLLTFTNKAADEMRHRLRDEIMKLRMGSSSVSEQNRADPRVTHPGLPEQTSNPSRGRPNRDHRLLLQSISLSLQRIPRRCSQQGEYFRCKQDTTYRRRPRYTMEASKLNLRSWRCSRCGHSSRDSVRCPRGQRENSQEILW